MEAYKNNVKIMNTCLFNIFEPCGWLQHFVRIKQSILNELLKNQASIVKELKPVYYTKIPYT